MSRDWSKAFGQASFKGVAFHVEEESASGGRRISVQYSAYGETHVSEDWGKKARDLPSRIYVAGDIADFEMISLISIFESKGPGLLKLPMQRPFLAHLRRYTMHRTKKVNGLIPCRVEFIAAGGGSIGGGFSFNAGLAAFKGLAQKIGQRVGRNIPGL